MNHLDDQLSTALHDLAPGVDPASARLLLAERVARARRRRQAVAVVAVVMAATVLALGVRQLAAHDPAGVEVRVAGPGPDAGPSPVVSTTGPAVDDPAFEVLAVHPAHSVANLWTATDQAGFAERWTDLPDVGPPPAVDFERWVVVGITIPDDACPPTLIDFDRDGSLITPRFVEDEGLCTYPLIPKTFVVALARSAWAAPVLTIRLPSQAPYWLGEQRRTVLLDPSASALGPAVPVQAPLYHCGFEPIELPPGDRTMPTRWVVLSPTFDATTPPAGYAGTGTLTQVSEHAARYVDDSGVEVYFDRWDEQPFPQVPCA